MIAYNSTNLVFAQTQSTDNNTAINLKSKITQANSSSDFKVILDKTVSNSGQRANNNSEVKNRNESAQGNDSQRKFKSFKDLRVAQTTTTEKSSVKSSEGTLRAEKVKNESENASASQDNNEEQINVLAQMLGITPAELVQLAENLGFTAVDLNDTGKLEQIVDKLGVQLQLDSPQKELLMKLTQEVSKQLATANSMTGQRPEITSEQPEATGMAEAAGSNTTDLSGIAEDIKAKLNGLLQKANTDNNAIGTEVSKVIEAMRAQTLNRVSVNTAETPMEDASITVENAKISGEPSNKADVASDNKAENKSTAKAEEENSEDKASAASETAPRPEAKPVSVQVGTNTDQSPQQQSVQALSDMKNGIVNNQTEVAKPTFTMPQTLKTGDLINQVVEQAKVVIGQDKTEMVIYLKPDHLGKLELKVVTEQGIVAAKFIAENQQVKEVIETNMQLLKDSLQKQGINIDGVSVQVGQDKRDEYRNNTGGNKNSSLSNRVKVSSISNLGTVGVSGTLMETLPERLAQYSYETSTINLTA